MNHLCRISITIACLIQILNAQAPDTLWTKTYGGISRDWSNVIQQTGDGGYIIAGNTISFGDANGNGDIWLIKTDAAGDTAWTKTFGGTDLERGYSVQQTSDEGYVLTGYTRTYGAGSYDVWLIKTDATGDTVWTKTFGGSNGDTGNSVRQTSDGGYIIAGYTQSYGEGDRDAWLIKTDASGDILWTKTFGGVNYDYASSVQQTSDGGYILSGFTKSKGAGLFDAWLIRTDTAGDTLWTRTFGGTGDDHGNAVQQTADGGYIIVGHTNSYGAGSDDGWLIKTDASGNMIWTKIFGGSNNDYFFFAHQTTDGGYIISGRTESYGDVNSDVWLIKTDATGDTVWTKTVGGSGEDGGSCVQQTSDGGYIVTGYTYSFGAGQENVWLIRLAPEDARGLVAHYPFNGNSNDESGNGNDGTVNGATLTTDRFGNASSAYSFDGVDDNIIINPISNFPSTEITASFWMLSSDTTHLGTPLSYASSTAENMFLVVDYKNFEINVNNVSSDDIGVSANDGTWRHIAVTWKSLGGEVIVYKDGLLSFSGTLSAGASMENGGSLVFGQEQDIVGGGFQSNQAFIGVLDDIRIYNRVLTEREIQQLYHDGGWDLVGEPLITSIEDVPEDQGRHVFVNWRASEWDHIIGLITQYGIWEQDLEDKWVSLGNTPALQDTAYTYLASTFKDSTDQGIYWNTFKLTAHTSDPKMYFTSAVDSGYSVDNIFPAVPEGLLAVVPAVGVIQLTWSDPVDEDFGHFRVHRSTTADFDPSGSEPLAMMIEPFFIDTTVITSETYYYRVSAVDANGNESDYSDVASATALEIDEAGSIPDEFALHANYPNPFNPVSTIRYDLPQATPVSLIVYDVLGREVIRLVDGYMEPSFHQVQWQGKDQYGRTVPSGIYIAQLVTPEYSKTIKMVLLK